MYILLDFPHLNVNIYAKLILDTQTPARFSRKKEHKKRGVPKNYPLITNPYSLNQKRRLSFLEIGRL